MFGSGIVEPITGSPEPAPSPAILSMAVLLSTPCAAIWAAQGRSLTGHVFRGVFSILGTKGRAACRAPSKLKGDPWSTPSYVEICLSLGGGVANTSNNSSKPPTEPGGARMSRRWVQLVNVTSYILHVSTIQRWISKPTTGLCRGGIGFLTKGVILGHRGAAARAIC